MVAHIEKVWQDLRRLEHGGIALGRLQRHQPGRRRELREHIWDMGARPAIPHQRHEAPVALPQLDLQQPQRGRAVRRIASATTSTPLAGPGRTVGVGDDVWCP